MLTGGEVFYISKVSPNTAILIDIARNLLYTLLVEYISKYGSINTMNERIFSEAQNSKKSKDFFIFKDYFREYSFITSNGTLYANREFKKKIMSFDVKLEEEYNKLIGKSK